MKKILISYNIWQTRVAIIQDGKLQNVYFASPTALNLERSFFKGVVTKVLPGIQTAFVDIGQERAGFLHISEIDHELGFERMAGTSEIDDEGNKENTPRKARPAMDISKILKEGEEILVQVSKEPIYEKGAKLTTCHTLPGRFIVLLPNIARIAISKKIEDRQERARLKQILIENLPQGMGAIIRTTSEGHSDTDILNDLSFLIGTWKSVQKKFASEPAKALLHHDIPIWLSAVRDYLSDDIEAIIIDDLKKEKEVYKFVKCIAPEYASKVVSYKEAQDIFDKFGINKQIQQALSSKVELKSGGSIIIETTQAMTVVDVNTGKYLGKSNLEDTILATNLEAAQEIVRQLRLRNIGGLIVIDFIDMATPQNKQKLFKFFEKNLKERDRFQSVVLKVSEFGLVQMTRKRSGKTLLQELTHNCTTCHGLGVVKSIRTQSYELLPLVKQKLSIEKLHGPLTLTLNTEIFEFIANNEYNAILELEKEYSCRITLSSDATLPHDQFTLKTS